MNRKEFLTKTGYLVMGFHLFPFSSCSPGREANGLSSPPDSNNIDAWLKLNDQGKVTLLTGKMELGQGIRVALKQIAAEELDVDIHRINIIIADTGQTPDERYTAGSASIESSGMSIRQAAAEARHRLVNMAAERLQTPFDSLIISDGLIRTRSKPEKSISYWELLQGKAIEGEVKGDAPTKNPKDYRLIGKAIPRDDIHRMVEGAPYYIQDLRFPDMLHARVVRPPGYQAQLLSIPEKEVKKMAGVKALIRNGDFLAVVAQEEYQAIRAQTYLRSATQWKKQALSPPPATLFDEMSNYNGEVKLVEEKGQINQQRSAIEATYTRPYHMHGSIGPSCALAKWSENKLTVWTHSQGVYPLRKSLSDLLNLPEESIHVMGVPGSGCYGHNGADDVAADVALIAQALPGKTIRLQWMREDEHLWEPYGSAMRIQLRADIQDGKISYLESDLWSDTHSVRPGGQASHLLAAQYVEPKRSIDKKGVSGGAYRNAVPIYAINNLKINAHAYEGPLRTSALRSLGAYANVFALESFIDELALASKEDPASFRLKHLTDTRAIAVIEALCDKVNWNKRHQTRDTGLGLAFAQYKNHASYFAVAAEIKVDRPNKRFKLSKLTGVIDAGQTINADGLKNQTEGGMIQSASWTLFEAVDYSADGIRSSSWENYPIMRFSDVPETEVIIIDRPEKEPLGGGEAAQGPTAAAIANALYAATGTRIRNLPLSADKVQW
ncbi:molybdopterin cofactor-binding domain-containing protein [Olivibacter sp. XZL3]|uniref:xanthine dehydrogenase family protein molybdopterin-binding subunit n=1 Tax=Olivibacter sp. XZL3 TaxID=1735116 RepID=UPI0010665CB6|nr:molybdopterin cofactor-binding domain-containing protein [Olivibacter sp. XZL3]